MIDKFVGYLDHRYRKLKVDIGASLEALCNHFSITRIDRSSIPVSLSGDINDSKLALIKWFRFRPSRREFDVTIIIHFSDFRTQYLRKILIISIDVSEIVPACSPCCFKFTVGIGEQ